MNEIDVENIKRILLIKEGFKMGGMLEESYLLSLSPLKLGQLLEDYKKDNHNKNLEEFKKRIDFLFDNFGKDDTDFIILSNYKQGEDDFQFGGSRNIIDCNEETIEVYRNKKWYNSIEIPNTIENNIRDKYGNVIFSLIWHISELYYKLDIPLAEFYFKDKNKVNCRRSGYIGIDKDYEIFAFVSCTDTIESIKKLCID